MAAINVVDDARAAQRRRIIVLACVSMATFGIVLTTLGASLPTVIARFSLDKRQAGSLLALLSFGVLAASVVFGPVVDRRGYRGMLLFAFAGIIVGLEAIAFAPSLPLLRVGLLLLGFTGGLVNGAGNALVADVSVEGRGAVLTFVGGFFGIGAAGVPLALAALSGTASSVAILATIPGLVLVPLALTATTAFPVAKQPREFPFAHARGLLRDSALLLMGVMLFLESGIETTIGGWTPTLFVEALEVNANRAPLYLALFWFGLMVTRLSLGAILRHASAIKVLFLGIAVALLSALVIVSSDGLAVATVAIFLLGCGLAGTFPVVYGFVGDRYTSLSGTALSVVITMALVGGMIMPYVAGILGGAYGLRGAFVLVPVSLVLIAMLLAAIARRIGMPAGAAARST